MSTTVTNFFTFNTLFTSAYAGATSLSITLSGVTLPPSVQDVTGLKITTYDSSDNGVTYLSVDEVTTTGNIMTVTEGSFILATVSVGTTYTSTKSSFTFTFQTMNAIPAGGSLLLTVPIGITVNS